jgi:hypothetical protein
VNRLAVLLVAVLVVGGLPVPATTASADTGTPTYVTGDVTTDTTWSSDDGPYVVTTDVTVASGATLTVEPGTTVQVAEEVTITVQGSLLTAGTAADPVVFTTAKPNPEPGSWETIQYAGSSDSVLRLSNTTVEYGVQGVNVTSSDGRIVVADSTIRAHVEHGIAAQATDDVPPIRVTGSEFSAIGYAGILFRAPGTNPYLESVRDVTVRDTTFSGTGTHGVAVWARQISDVTIDDSFVSDTREAGVMLSTERAATRQTISSDRGIADVAIRGTRINDVGADGIQVATDTLDEFTVASSEIRDVRGIGVNVERTRDVDDVQITSNVVAGAETGVAVSVLETEGPLRHVSMTVAGNDLRENDEYGLRIDSVYVVVDRLALRGNTFAANGREGALVTTPVFDNSVAADNVARGNGGAGIEFGGTYVRDLSATGNRLVDNGASGVRIQAAGETSAVHLTDNDAFDNAAFGIDLEHHATGAARTELHNNTVAGNVRGIRYAGPTAVLATNNSVVFNTQSDRDGSVDSVGPATGVVVENVTSDVTLRDNDIYGHVVGLQSDADGTVTAERNYWGAESGPFHASVNPSGAGNAIETDSGKAAIVPFDESRNGPLFERPTAALTANRTTVQPDDPVRFSAAESTDDDGVATYHFVVDGEPLAPQESPTVRRAFTENGTHQVSVVVEDAQGVESATAASVNVTVDPSPNDSTTTDGNQTDDNDPPATTTTTTQSPPNDSRDDETGLVGSLLSTTGLLGGLFYLLALLVGAYGTYLSLNGRSPPVRGRFIHATAGVGVFVWTVGGFLGSGSTFSLGVGGAILWVGLTGGLFVLATR